MTKNEAKKKRIGVLMGGLSPEREISLKTGSTIVRTLREQGYRVSAVDVDRSVARVLQQEKIEVAFIALHGPWGEDGAMQGLLEMMGIPYTGSSVLASAIAMDKEVSKKLFRYHQLPTPEFHVLTVQRNGVAAAVSMPLPVVIKPVCGGSTIGTSIVRAREELEHAVRDAAQYDTRILIEQYIDGTDLTVGVIDGEHLPVIQIVPKSGFYDFGSKYTPGQTEYLVPAPIPNETTAQAQALAVAAYRSLSCSGAARVDFRLNLQGSLTILEVNTIPGFTETSLLPKAAAAAGIDFPTLTERILLSARLHIV